MCAVSFIIIANIILLYGHSFNCFYSTGLQLSIEGIFIVCWILVVIDALVEVFLDILWVGEGGEGTGKIRTRAMTRKGDTFCPSTVS